MGDTWQGLAGGRTLHEWLLDSAYVRRGDDLRLHGSRKKGRTRKGAKCKHDDAGLSAHVASSQVDQAPVAPASLPGKRKARRWMNERLLRDLAGPLDASSISSLYAPPPWGEKSERPLLESVTAVGFSGSQPEMALWAPFRNGVDMDRQDHLLATTNRSLPRQHPPAAVLAWRGVERRAREALKRSAHWALLPEIEDEILHFQSAEEEELILEVDAPFVRLIIHGVCQFHGFTARSIHGFALEDGKTGCVVSVQRGTGGSLSDLRLSTFLRQVEVDA